MYKAEFIIQRQDDSYAMSTDIEFADATALAQFIAQQETEVGWTVSVQVSDVCTKDLKPVVAELTQVLGQYFDITQSGINIILIRKA